MSVGVAQQASFLDELELRQDAVLTELEDLNGRIESLLNQCSPIDSREPEPTSLQTDASAIGHQSADGMGESPL